jgi:hypothetical protein
MNSETIQFCSLRRQGIDLQGAFQSTRDDSLHGLCEQMSALIRNEKDTVDELSRRTDAVIKDFDPPAEVDDASSTVKQLRATQIRLREALEQKEKELQSRTHHAEELCQRLAEMNRILKERKPGPNEQFLTQLGTLTAQRIGGVR